MGVWFEKLDLVTVLEQATYEVEKEEEAQRVQQMSRQYQWEIARAVQELYQHMQQTSQDLGLDGKPEEVFAFFVKELPLYAFYQVIREHGGRPTQEQGYLLDVFCKQLKLPYSDIDLLLAVNAPNELRQRLEGVFALPEGGFWKVLLLALQGKPQAEAVLDTLVQKYGDIVMRYSLLGDPDSEAPVVIMNQLVDYLNDWLMQHPVEAAEEEKNIDYVTAYQRMTAAYEEAAAEVKAEDEGLPVTDLYVYFVMGLIQKLLQPAKLSMQDKADIIDGVIRSCKVPVELTGVSILESILAKDEIGGSIEMMTEFGPEHGNLWQIMQAMAVKCGKIYLITDFLESSSLFMTGLEKAIQTEYPGSIREGKAAEYIGIVAESLSM